MGKDNIHIVFIDPCFAEKNIEWLKKFVFCSQGKQSYFFSCTLYKFAQHNFVQFEVHTKTNAEKADILLPAHAIVGIFLEENRKNQFGFLDQEICHE